MPTTASVQSDKTAQRRWIIRPGSCLCDSPASARRLSRPVRRELRLLEALSRALKGSGTPCARLSIRATADEMAARSVAELSLMEGLVSMLLAGFRSHGGRWWWMSERGSCRHEDWSSR